VTSAPIPASFLAEARPVASQMQDGSEEDAQIIARALHAAHRRGRDEGIEAAAQRSEQMWRKFATRADSEMAAQQIRMLKQEGGK
jgi:hypothetical protein